MDKQMKALWDAQRQYVEDDLGLPQCSYCKHQTSHTTCAAFPELIPIDIIGNLHDHQEAYPGDNGIRFEPVEEKP